MTPWMNYVMYFLLGGAVVTSMTFFARNSNPKAAALIYALPLQFSIVAVLAYIGTSKKTIQELSVYSVYALLISIGFIVLFYILMKKMGFWASFALAYAIFLALGAIFLWIF